MFKKRNVVIIIIILIVGLCASFAIIDYNRAKKNKLPIFIIKTGEWKSGGAKEYYGLGYKIIKCKNENNPIQFGLYWGAFVCASEVQDSDIYSVELTKTKSCDNQPKLYYTLKDRKIYTYCLDEIVVNNSIALKDFLKTNSNAMDKIINNLTATDYFNDGGTTIYRDNNNYSNTGLSIIKCNKLMGTNDYYIGDENLNLKEGFCE